MEQKAGPQKNKLKLLYLLSILRQETDEDHPLSASALCERLQAMGISCERKSIYRDMDALNDFGYEIISTRSPRQGFFLASRELEPPEVRLLLDAVATAPFITEKKTAELTEKLCAFLSQSQRETVREQIWNPAASQRVKLDNEEVYYNIDAIHRAIDQGKRIAFTYFHKVIVDGSVKQDPGRTFCISPYAMVWNEDKYYLVGNYDKYDNLSNYRIDRMKHVTVTEESARPFWEVCPDQSGLDTAGYLRSTFFMYGGEEQTVSFSCEDGLLESMADKFGRLRDLKEKDGRFTFAAQVRCSDGFYNWVLRWGGRVVVTAPESVRAEIAKKIRTLADSYGVAVSGEKHMLDEDFHTDGDQHQTAEDLRL